MTKRMLKFVSTAQTPPEKRAADDRSDDFHEIYREYIADKAQEQSSRCSQCGVPFCQQHCPLGNNIPDWLMLTAEGRLEEAFEVSSGTNNMPEICGRICPQDRLCEGSCVIEQSGHGTVTIGAVEKYITDTAWDKGWVKPIIPPKERNQSVGVIGAGPGGLAAAEQMRRKGYKVTVYDRYDRAGGLLVYGIPGFKLEKYVVERRTKRLEESGVEFVLNCEIGKDLSFDDLRARHDTVLIATGVYKGRALTMPGSGADGVYPALEYLTASNRKSFGDTVEAFDNGQLNAEGKRVVVIGGGDTAMDCVRTAIRQGASSVTCLYRRNRENMPGSQREVTNAEEEGVVFEWLAAPKAIADNGGKVSSVKAVRMRLGLPDSSGRQAPEEVPGSEFDLEADMVIQALGFDPEDLPIKFDENALTVNRWGAVRINYSTMMTSIDGVFAVGDIVRGASLVVWAIKDGRDAAEKMHEYLQKKAAELAPVAAE
ncbi:NAD(P)-dependent oxidoreductase [Ponticaulis profundi]|uniref:NAD(P)-dependent oxidoreductase n=1 Tax=Ponticaulis profundi TaxID=2665222 RepID=A0ABW1SB30_9PROT